MNPNINQGQQNPINGGNPGVNINQQGLTQGNMNQNINPQVNPTISQAMPTVNQVDQNQIYQAQMMKNQMNQTQTNPQSNQVPPTNLNQENKKEANLKGKKGGSGLSLIVIAILLIGFTIGLPYITDYINKEEEEQVQTPTVEEDVHGLLKCSTMKNSDVATTTTYSLYHTNNRLTSASFETKTTLLSTTDEAKEILKNLEATCETLKENLKEYSYIAIVCDYKENQQTSTNTLDNLKDNQELIDYTVIRDTGFTVDYAYNQDIKTLRNKLTTEGYTCNNQTLNKK